MKKETEMIPKKVLLDWMDAKIKKAYGTVIIRNSRRLIFASLKAFIKDYKPESEQTTLTPTADELDPQCEYFKTTGKQAVGVRNLEEEPSWNYDYIEWLENNFGKYISKESYQPWEEQEKV